MKELKISKEISFPPDVVTQTIAVLAKRRAGKSYTMRRFTEQLLKAHQQVVIVDPKGDQWGIRSAKDGKGPGFPIVILGGEHGDVPLEKTGGEIVAKLVVEEGVSVLLDLSMFRKYEIAIFMTDFLENLYRLKAQEKYRTALMLVIDEADAIAPQKPQKGEERMLGAAEDIVRRGGQRGIGCMLVTQRSAVLNKNVLTQAQMLIVLRTIAPQDLAAMNAWIDVHGEPEQRKILMESLPALPIGDAWFWSPGWPTEEGIFMRSHVLPIETFDSGATPKPGEKRVIPKNLADVDLSALKKQMAGTIEKMQKDDPKALRKRIAELERASNNTRGTVTAPVIDTRAIQKAMTANDRKWQAVLQNANAEIKKIAVITEKIKALLPSTWPIFEVPKELTNYHPLATKIVDRLYMPKNIKVESHTKSDPIPVPLAVNVITGSEQKVLDALAWCESINILKAPNELIAFLSGYAHARSTGYTNPRGYLNSKGLITYSNGTVSLTTEGRVLADTPDTPLTQSELHRVVLDRLTGSERKVLKPLLERYPDSISNTELCALAGYEHERSTGYTNPRGRLRAYGLINYEDGQVKAEDILFMN